VRTELEQALLDDPARAIQRISALRRDEIIPAGELDGFLDDAVERIRAGYEAAVLADDFDAQIIGFRNLAAVGAVTGDDAYLSELYLENARALRDAGNGPAALATLMRAPLLSALPPEALGEAAELARELNNRHALGILLGVLGPEWQEEHPEIVDFAQSVASPVEMSDGVVTVWVNRGLRLESGVGIPDRVIGSGFFVDPRGYLITNYHVIASEVDPEYEGYSRLYVRLPSDPAERIPARVVGYSRLFDVALVKVEVDAPYVFSLTDIRALEPGSSIFAIGSPGGLENSISSGIISATGRRFLQMGDAMQVDVPINPGNSGGPLLDSSGRVVGLVFAGIEQFEGVNFAIPSYWLQGFFPDLYDARPVIHPWLGVSVVAESGGLEVTFVAKDSPAEQGGLEVGDILQSIDGVVAERIGEAQSTILQGVPGVLVEVGWTRDGAEMSGLFQLAGRPESPVEIALDRDVHDRLFPVLFGMEVERTGGFRIRQSYEVTRVYRGSLADETGIETGDSFVEQDFEFDDDLDVVFLRMFIRKRTDGFMQTSIQLPAYVERDTFL
jgi:S1-C subfamily serine protease